MAEGGAQLGPLPAVSSTHKPHTVSAGPQHPPSSNDGQSVKSETETLEKHELPPWDQKNRDQDDPILYHPEYKEKLDQVGPIYSDDLKLDKMWVHLQKLGVLEETDVERIKDRRSRPDQVSELLRFIKKGPMWHYHSLMRALALTGQSHLIPKGGPPNSIYMDWVSNPNRKPLSPTLLKAIQKHALYCERYLKRGHIFSFDGDNGDDIIDISRCFVQVQPKMKDAYGPLTLVPIDTKKAIQQLPDEKFLPLIIRLYGQPGDRKTSFTTNVVYDWACSFQKQLIEEDCNLSLSGEQPYWTTMVFILAKEIGEAQTVEDVIRNNLGCKKEDEDEFMKHIEHGEGVLIGIDAYDELCDQEAIQKLKQFIKKCSRRGGPTILIACRTALCDIDVKDIDRFLVLEGFTEDEGLQYIQLYTEICQLSEDAPRPPLLAYVKHHREKMRPILMNPLKLHLFCALAMRGDIELNTQGEFNIPRLFFPLEKFLLKREYKKEGIVVTESESNDFYRFCMEALLQNNREFSESTLAEYKIAKPYYAFLSRSDRKNKDCKETFYSFRHEMVLEFFASRYIYSLSEESRLSMLLLICSKKRWRNVQKIIFHLLLQDENENWSLARTMIRLMLILQHDITDTKLVELLLSEQFTMSQAFQRKLDKQSGRWNPKADIVFDLLQDIKDKYADNSNERFLYDIVHLKEKMQEIDVSSGNILHTNWEENLSSKAKDICEEVTRAFETHADLLKMIGWFFEVEDAGTMAHVEDCLQVCSPQLKTNLMSDIVQHLLPCSSGRADRKRVIAIDSTRWVKLEKGLESRTSHHLRIHCQCPNDAMETLNQLHQIDPNWESQVVHQLHLHMDKSVGNINERAFSKEEWDNLLHRIPSEWGKSKFDVTLHELVPLTGLAQCLLSNQLYTNKRKHFMITNGFAGLDEVLLLIFKYWGKLSLLGIKGELPDRTQVQVDLQLVPQIQKKGLKITANESTNLSDLMSILQRHEQIDSVGSTVTIVHGKTSLEDAVKHTSKYKINLIDACVELPEAIGKNTPTGMNPQREVQISFHRWRWDKYWLKMIVHKSLNLTSLLHHLRDDCNLAIWCDKVMITGGSADLDQFIALQNLYTKSGVKLEMSHTAITSDDIKEGTIETWKESQIVIAVSESDRTETLISRIKDRHDQMPCYEEVTIKGGRTDLDHAHNLQQGCKEAGLKLSLHETNWVLQDRWKPELKSHGKLTTSRGYVHSIARDVDKLAIDADDSSSLDAVLLWADRHSAQLTNCHITVNGGVVDLNTLLEYRMSTIDVEVAETTLNSQRKLRSLFPGKGKGNINYTCLHGHTTIEALKTTSFNQVMECLSKHTKLLSKCGTLSLVGGNAVIGDLATFASICKKESVNLEFKDVVIELPHILSKSGETTTYITLDKERFGENLSISLEKASSLTDVLSLLLQEAACLTWCKSIDIHHGTAEVESLLCCLAQCRQAGLKLTLNNNDNIITKQLIEQFESTPRDDTQNMFQNMNLSTDSLSLTLVKTTPLSDVLSWILRQKLLLCKVQVTGGRLEIDTLLDFSERFFKEGIRVDLLESNVTWYPNAGLTERASGSTLDTMSIYTAEKSSASHEQYGNYITISVESSRHLEFLFSCLLNHIRYLSEYNRIRVSGGTMKFQQMMTWVQKCREARIKPEVYQTRILTDSPKCSVDLLQLNPTSITFQFEPETPIKIVQTQMMQHMSQLVLFESIIWCGNVKLEEMLPCFFECRQAGLAVKLQKALEPSTSTQNLDLFGLPLPIMQNPGSFGGPASGLNFLLPGVKEDDTINNICDTSYEWDGPLIEESRNTLTHHNDKLDFRLNDETPLASLLSCLVQNACHVSHCSEISITGGKADYLDLLSCLKNSKNVGLRIAIGHTHILPLTSEADEVDLGRNKVAWAYDKVEIEVTQTVDVNRILVSSLENAALFARCPIVISGGKAEFGELLLNVSEFKKAKLNVSFHELSIHFRQDINDTFVSEGNVNHVDGNSTQSTEELFESGIEESKAGTQRDIVTYDFNKLDILLNDQTLLTVPFSSLAQNSHLSDCSEINVTGGRTDFQDLLTCLLNCKKAGLKISIKQTNIIPPTSEADEADLGRNEIMWIHNKVEIVVTKNVDVNYILVNSLEHAALFSKCPIVIRGGKADLQELLLNVAKCKRANLNLTFHEPDIYFRQDTISQGNAEVVAGKLTWTTKQLIVDLSPASSLVKFMAGQLPAIRVLYKRKTVLINGGHAELDELLQSVERCQQIGLKMSFSEPHITLSKTLQTGEGGFDSVDEHLTWNKKQMIVTLGTNTSLISFLSSTMFDKALNLSKCTHATFTHGSTAMTEVFKGLSLVKNVVLTLQDLHIIVEDIVPQHLDVSDKQATLTLTKKHLHVDLTTKSEGLLSALLCTLRDHKVHIKGRKISVKHESSKIPMVMISLAQCKDANLDVKLQEVLITVNRSESTESNQEVTKESTEYGWNKDGMCINISTMTPLSDILLCLSENTEWLSKCKTVSILNGSANLDDLITYATICKKANINLKLGNTKIIRPDRLMENEEEYQKMINSPVLTDVLKKRKVYKVKKRLKKSKHKQKQ